MAHPIAQPTVDEAQVRLLENEEAYIERHLAMLAAALADESATLDDQLESAAVTVIEVLCYHGAISDWSVKVHRGAVEVESRREGVGYARVTAAGALWLAKKLFEVDPIDVAELVNAAPYAGRAA